MRGTRRWRSREVFGAGSGQGEDGGMEIGRRWRAGDMGIVGAERRWTLLEDRGLLLAWIAGHMRALPGVFGIVLDDSPLCGPAPAFVQYGV